MNLFLNSDDGPSDHIISCTALGSSVQYPRLCHRLMQYVLHTDL